MPSRNDTTPSADSSDETDVLETLVAALRDERNEPQRRALQRALGLPDTAPAGETAGTPGTAPGVADTADSAVGATDETSADAASTDTALEDVQTELEAATTEIEQLQADIADLNAADNVLRRRLEGTLQPQLDSVTNRLEALDSQLEHRRSETTSSLADFEATCTALEDSIAELEADVDTYGDRLTELETRIDTVERTLESRTDELAAQTDEAEVRLKRELLLLRSAFSGEIERVDDTLDALEATVGTDHDTLNDFDTTLSELETRLAELEAEADAASDWRHSLRDAIQSSSDSVASDEQ
ncbi:coiled-coil domain-containing protein 154 [Natrialba taiwanensis]|uniref:Chromosome segregation ATPase-like protein n=1 Tax=Natrialba taiwanensis DSM 12281 TaxID=1230458 RepID=L9ZG61_9EURY|nr:coiled-coil domain-containing protein 154 [Natrialba taiwanensis]ELY85334.1 hypothetical protein C484_20877 [Natrialba taiwanensis DSM 12281]